MTAMAPPAGSAGSGWIARRSKAAAEQFLGRVLEAGIEGEHEVAAGAGSSCRWVPRRRPL